MPIEHFIKYKGRLYDVGTKLRFKVYLGNFSYRYCLGVIQGVIERFDGSSVFIRGNDGELYNYSTIKNLENFDNVIVEIIEPIYYTPKHTNTNERDCPPEWDVENGWMWYVTIMLVAVIFKARVVIWVLATVVFLLWKNGFLNGGNK